jgi:hypothetical protein
MKGRNQPLVIIRHRLRPEAEAMGAGDTEGGRFEPGHAPTIPQTLTFWKQKAGQRESALILYR